MRRRYLRGQVAMSRCRAVRTAIIDTGVSGRALGRPKVPEVTLRVGPGGLVRVRRRRSRDYCGHGTVCAAILLGLAPQVELWSVSIVGDDRRACLIDLAAAIQWCVLAEVKVASISLGAADPEAAALAPACAMAEQAGVVLVAPSPLGGPVHFPAALPGVISVGAEHLPEGVVRHHAFGVPEFAASGEPRFVQAGEEGLAYGGSFGPSYAAPRVAALAALLKERLPDARVGEIRDALIAQAARGGVST